MNEITEQKLREQMVATGLSLFQRGYATGGAGNLSLILPNGHVLATPTGSSMGRLDASTLSVVDIEGNHLSGDRPSKEISFHLALYRANPKFKAIVHLHSTYLTALSCLNNLDTENAIRPFTPYVVMRIGPLPVIPYYKPGSVEIGIEMAKRADKARSFLLANHGSVVTGSDLYDALDNSEELEETAKLLFILNNQPIKYLTEDEIEALKGMGK